MSVFMYACMSIYVCVRYFRVCIACIYVSVPHLNVHASRPGRWVKQLLDLGPVGGYIVREPDSQADAYALVVKTTPTKTKNFLIKCEVLDGVHTVRLGIVLVQPRPPPG